MKTSITILCLFVSMTAFTQNHSLEMLWETDTVVAVPESVLPAKDLLYVSLIDGASWIPDGKGGVAKIGTDGKILDTAWITGLNAPKGMGIKGNHLYIADMFDVVVVNIKKGIIEKKIPIDSAQALNDLTVTDNGIIFVSDSKRWKVWRIENDIPVLYLDSMTGVNGLKAIGEDLYIGSGKRLLKADAKKNITVIAEVTEGIDGIEPVGNGDFILTAWAGYIWYVHAGGRVETLLETYRQKRNTADIGYDQKNRILYVPTFNAKTVAAYRLK